MKLSFSSFKNRKTLMENSMVMWKILLTPQKISVFEESFSEKLKIGSLVGFYPTIGKYLIYTILSIYVNFHRKKATPSMFCSFSGGLELFLSLKVLMAQIEGFCRSLSVTLLPLVFFYHIYCPTAFAIGTYKSKAKL